LLHLLAPTRGREGGRIAPGVVVESEEVTADIGATAVHILGHLETVRIDISGRVSDRNASVRAGFDVLLHVTRDGLYVGSGEGSIRAVENLVGRVVQEGVVVLGKSVNSGKDALKIDIVVRPENGRRVLAVERVVGSVDVEGEVDAGIGEGLHAGVVGGRVVDRVDTDGVDSELLELGDITLAAISIGNGILEGGRTARLVVNATDVEPLAAGEEGYKLYQWWAQGDEAEELRDGPLPWTVTGGVLGLETALARLSMDGEAKTDEARAEAARRAVDPFMTVACISIAWIEVVAVSREKRGGTREGGKSWKLLGR
jgi:hypothetical protein